MDLFGPRRRGQFFQRKERIGKVHKSSKQTLYLFILCLITWRIFLKLRLELMSWLEALVCRRRALVFWLILWLGMLRGMLRRMLGMLRIGLLHVQFMGTLCLVLVHLRRIVAGRRMECFLGRRRLLPHMRHLWLVVSLLPMFKDVS